MTIEELEIVVTAKVEEALTKFKSIEPKMKQSMKQVQETINKVDFKEMKSKLDSSISTMKNRMSNLKNSIQQKFSLNLNNKEAKEQITQIEKEIESLQKKISASNMELNINTEKLDSARNSIRNKIMENNPNVSSKTVNMMTESAMLNNGAIQKMVAETDELANGINRDITKVAELKAKLEELKSGRGFSSIFSKAEESMRKFSTVSKGAISKVAGGMKDISQKISGGMGSAIQKVSGLFSKLKGHSSGIGDTFKNGLKNVLKYAGALFGIRTIYNVLRNSAQAWLSSQNAQAQQLSANIEYMKYAMGSVFAPVIEYVINLVYQLMKALQSIVYAFSGINIFAKATAKSMKSASGSAKDANKSLVGVHNEINNISENKGGGGGGVSPSMDLSQMDNTPNDIIEALKNGNWYEIGAMVGEKLNEALEKIPWDQIQESVRNVATGLALTLNGFIETTDWELVGGTIAQGLNTSVYFAQSFLHTFNWSALGQSIADSVNGFIEDADWSALGDTISTALKGALDTVIAFVKDFDWGPVLEGLGDFIANFDWNGVAESIVKLLGTACASLVNLGMYIGTYIKKAFQGIGKFFNEAIEACGGNIVAGILLGIVEALRRLGQWVIDHIFHPFIEAFKSAFGIHSPSTVMMEMGKYIIEGLLEGIKNIVQKVGEVWNNLKNKVVELSENIKEKLKEKWESIKTNAVEKFNNVKEKITTAWDNVKTSTTNRWNEITSGVSSRWESIKSTATEKFNNIKNKISDTWNNIKNDGNLSSMTSTIKDTFSGLGQSALTWGRDLVTNMANGIRNNVDKVKSAVNSLASKIKGLLGFSEPEEGPLSNFHTYMPDMIDLMVSGIRNNMHKVTKELENMTNNMSYTINTPDLSPLSVNSVGNIDVKQMGMYETMRQAFEDTMFNNGDEQQINLVVNVGNRRLGQILIDDLRDMKRQTGKDLEALIGG